MRGASAPPIPPSSPPQTTVHSNTSFPIKHCRMTGHGGVSRALGCWSSCVQSVEEVRVAEPRRPIRWHLAERANRCAPDLRFSLRKCGSKTNSPLKCHQNAFAYFVMNLGIDPRDLQSHSASLCLSEPWNVRRHLRTDAMQIREEEKRG